MAQTGNLLDAPHLRRQPPTGPALIGGAHRTTSGRCSTTLGIAERAERLAATSCPAASWPGPSLAVALVNAPDVLLADEPTGELDEATEARLLDAGTHARADSGCAVLVASHSPAVRRAADRVLLLDDGRLAA